jgi:hypothetical protein
MLIQPSTALNDDRTTTVRADGIGCDFAIRLFAVCFLLLLHYSTNWTVTVTAAVGTSMRKWQETGADCTAPLLRQLYPRPDPKN